MLLGDMGLTGHRRMGPMAHNLHWRPRMLSARLILFGLVLAQLVDALTFTIGVSRFGIGLESNGMAVGLYRSAGLDGVLLAKRAAVLAAIAVVTIAADRFPRLLVWGGAAATSLGLLGFATNTATIVMLGG